MGVAKLTDMDDALWEPKTTASVDIDLWESPVRGSRNPDTDGHYVMPVYRPTTIVGRACLLLDLRKIRPKDWSCSYGCPGVVVGQDAKHIWDCPYWWNEGAGETPF